MKQFRKNARQQRKDQKEKKKNKKNRQKEERKALSLASHAVYQDLSSDWPYQFRMPNGTFMTVRRHDMEAVFHAGSVLSHHHKGRQEEKEL